MDGTGRRQFKIGNKTRCGRLDWTGRDDSLAMVGVVVIVVVFFSNFLFRIFGGIPVVNTQPGTGFRYIYCILSGTYFIQYKGPAHVHGSYNPGKISLIFGHLSTRNKIYCERVVTEYSNRNSDSRGNGIQTSKGGCLIRCYSSSKTERLVIVILLVRTIVVGTTEIQEHLQSVVCLIISVKQTKKVITYCNKARTIDLHFTFFP